MIKVNLYIISQCAINARYRQDNPSIFSHQTVENDFEVACIPMHFYSTVAIIYIDLTFNSRPI